jgi:hypothetical protein
MELKEVNKLGKAKCGCCGYFTISMIADICPVCYWEESLYQEEINSGDEDAPNFISLSDAQNNFRKFGAVKNDFFQYVRPPLPEEKF